MDPVLGGDAVPILPGWFIYWIIALALGTSKSIVLVINTG